MGEIYLGDMTCNELEARLGITMKQKDKDALWARHQERAANVEKGKIHIFDIPFEIVCGDNETAQWVVDMLTAYGPSNFKCALQIGVQH